MKNKSFYHSLCSFFIIILSVLWHSNVRASHVPGGNITYECVGPNQYLVTLTLYEDCGTNFETSGIHTINISNDCGYTTPTSLSLNNTIFQQEVSQLCPSQISQSECGTGTLPGVYMHQWEAVITLPAGCDSWTFYYSLCCRNTATNQSGQGTFYIETDLNNQDAPCNSSPVIGADPIPYVCVNQPVSWDPQASEPDGNILEFSLVPAQTSAAATITYNAGYTGSSPIPGITIDPATGLINFTPTTIGNYVVAIQIDEYDAAGNLVGSITQDFQFEVINCTNQVPSPPAGGLTNFSGTATQGGPSSISICSMGENFCFDIVFNDADGGNNVTLTSNVTSILPGATFQQIGTNPSTARICWTAVPGYTGSIISVQAEDNACPIPGFSTFTVDLNIAPPLIVSDDESYCGNGSALLSAIGSGPFTWSVVSGEPLSLGTNFSCNPCSNPTASPNTTTTYQVTDGCGNTDQVTVTVVSNTGGIDATVSGSASICPGQCVTLSGTTQETTAANGAVTFSTSAQVPIQDYVYANSPINVSGLNMTNLSAGSIQSVCVNISHTWVGDISLTLICPSGQTLLLSQYIGGSGDNYSGTCFTVSAVSNITSGAAPYTGNWIPQGGSLNNLAGCLANGTYTLQVYDYLGGFTGTILSWSITFNDNTTTTGPATSFAWSPVTNMSNSNTLTPTVCPTSTTTYTLYAYNANGCYDSSNVVITVVPPAAPTISVVNESCNGANDGSATATPNHGSAPYTYSWSPTGGAGATASNLPDGTYTVTITAANGCIATGTATIAPGPNLTAGFTYNGNQCSGNAFNFTNTTTGATAYSWNFGAAATPSTSTAANPTGIVYNAPGTYPVTLTATNGGCSGTTTVNVTVNAPPVPSITVTNPLCAGQNGSLSASATGGSSPYNYSWSGGLGTGANKANVPPGTYTVTVTTANGCTATATATITAPPALTSTISGTNVSCFGGNNSTSTVVPSGGTGAYTYSWSPAPGGGQGTATATGLSATAYTVTITDANGCTATNTFTPAQPTAVASTASFTPATCNGSATGTATASPSGGTPGYTYSWNTVPVQTTQTATGLTAGAYTVTVTDANGCTAAASATVTQPTPVTATATATNTSCNGGTNGTATVTPSGGTAGYTYSWNTAPIQTTQTATALPAGTYTVTVTDANGCITTTTATVSQPTAVTATTSATNASCNGGTNGTATASPAGGTPAYSYSWNTVPVQTSQTASGLSAGTYTVTVTDANGCTTTATATVTEPTLVTALASNTPATCNGSATGTATATPGGGTAGYTYSWNSTPAQTSQTATGLIAGTYTVTITDANGCTATASTTITEPTAVTATTSATNVSCNGGSNGTATVTPAGGTAGYTYTWNTTPIQTIQTATGLPAGTYTATVTDTNGCTTTATATVTQPTALSGTIASQTNVTCSGLSNGSVNISASGGTSSYQYNIGSGNQATGSFTGLAANSYTVTLTDANGCTATVPVTITEPAPLSATIAPVVLACNGVCNGQATVAASGGSGSYTYTWDNSGFSTTATTSADLCAQTYNVTVADAMVPSCTTTASVTVTEPSAITLTTSTTNSSCGGATGTATVNPAGGAGGFTYSWNTTPAQTAQTAINLASAGYTVTVTDANGCSETANATVASDLAPTASEVAGSHVDVLCNGAATGSAEVTAVGGTAPYTYSWSPSGGTAATATGLAAGTYNVTVTDVNSCSDVVSITITQPAVMNSSATVTANALCNGGSTGSANVSVSGGVAGYTYNWFSGTSPTGTSIGQTTASASSLAAGSYYVEITDANGCVLTSNSITITEPSLLTASGIGTDVLCNGGSTGSIDLTVAGGTAPYSYAWTGTAFTSAIEDPSSLEADTYDVTVTDANGCAATAQVIITEPAAVSVTPSQTPEHCGLSDGTLSGAGTGGTGTITFEWFNDAGLTSSVGTGSSLTGMPAGTYYLQGTDANGCAVSASVVIANLTGPSASAVVNTHVTGAGLCNGNATVTPSGGTSPYTFLWDNGETAATASALCAGTSCVTVTDANGCTANTCITVNEPGPLAVVLTPVDLICNGICAGSISSSTTGGVPPYTYAWSNSATSANLTALCAGTYTLIVTDANGNTVTQNSTVNEPVAITISSATGTDPLCSGSCDGTLTAAASGGTGTLVYTWSGLGAGQTQSSVCSGTYPLTVTDANGCTANNTVTLTDPPVLTVSTTPVDAHCGLSDGSASAASAGGSGSAIFEWFSDAGLTNSIGTGSSILNIPAGTYYAQATDANGCTANAPVTISDLGGPAATAVVDANVSGAGLCNGGATVTASGGVSPYTYLWDNGETGATATTLCAGNNCVTVTDASGCTVDVCVTITEPMPLSATLTPTDLLCNGICGGSVTSSVTGGVPPYTYAWSTGATTAGISSLCAGSYTLDVTDANGNTFNISTTVSQPAALSIVSISSTDALCNGSCDGTVDVSGAGGTGVIQYNWTGVGLGASQTGLCAGTYNVTLFDDNGCTLPGSIVVSEPTPLVISTSTVNANCGNNDGSATATVTGGTPGYSYSWDAGSLTDTQNNIALGTYTVTVTDANGCVETQTASVGNNPAGTLTVTADNMVSCFAGNDGQATAAVTGGAGPFTYSWNSTPVQNSATATGLPAGNYTVTVTDVNLCVITGSVTITEPPLLTVSASATNVSCYAGTDGTVSSVTTGGTLPYTLNWVNFTTMTSAGTTDNLSGLASTAYEITVTDGNGCIAIDTVTVYQPDTIQVTIITNDVSCFGLCDGSASASVTGGTTPYSYQWNNSLMEVTPAAQQLCAQTYQLIVTDDNGCTYTADAVINEPTAILLTSTTVNSNCGQADGSGCVNASGGTPPYIYTWPDGSTSNCISNVIAGSYLVEVRDANDCIEQITVDIIDVGGPQAGIIDSVMVSCFNGTDGSATVDIVGGSGFFTVQWDASAGSQTTPTASNLSEGTYTVTITDTQTGCNASDDVVITHPDPIVYVINTTDASCFGFCDGQSDINAIGGTLPYSYQWLDNGGAALPSSADSITGLCAGNYTVILTDANGCIIDDQFIINQPVDVIITTTSTDISCFNVCDGTGTVNIISGVAPYSYQWDAAANSQTTSTATGLCDGDFVVTVTDANDCSASDTISVLRPTLLTTDIDLSGNVSCASFCDGFAQVVYSGGTSPYTILWSNGAVSATNNNLCQGTYSVEITDANGCTASDSVAITQPTGLAIALSQTDANCFNSCDGTASVSITGGTLPYSIQWDDDFFSTNDSISGLCADNYNVIVTDANNCSVSGSVTVNEPPILDFAITSQDANCGQDNGWICMNTIGGVAPYFYTWDDPSLQTTACAFNLLAGCYVATVTDGNGCVKDSLICISDIAGPTVSVTSFSDVTCNGYQDGSVTINASGGVGVLEIVWEDGTGTVIPSLNDQTTSNTLSGDTYAFIVTDTAGCVAATTQFIFEPNIVFAAITSSTDPSCFGGCNGNATVSVSGGVSGYTYNWTGGATPAVAQNTGLCAGSYPVTVQDANGCPATATAVLSEPTQLTGSTVSVENVNCFSFCDGQITVSASGATPPYSYSWTNNVSSGTLATNLCPGNYITDITDAQGCIVSLNNTITEPAPINLSTTVTDATCSQCNGAAGVSVSGGTLPYSYMWSGGASPASDANTGMCAGTHNITVTDNNGCVATVNLTVNDQAGPTITGMTFTQPLCFGLSSGTATVLTNGGTGPLIYEWNNGQNTSTATALAAGNYCVTVSDQNNCQATNCVNVTQPNPLNPVGDLETTICFGDSTQLWASGQGGTAPYTINWSTPGLSGAGPIMVTPATTSAYCFTVTDANGCLSPNNCIDITVNPPLSLDLTPPLFICDQTSTTLTAQATGGNGGPYTFTWTDQNGNPVASNANGDVSTAVVSPTVPTWYYVLLNDGCSLPVVDSTQVSINALPLALMNVVDAEGCEPFTAQFIMNTDIGVQFDYDFNCDGFVDYSGTNPNATFTYVSQGVYDVCATVTTAAGCTTNVSQPQYITVNPTPAADFSMTPPLTTFMNPSIQMSDLSAGSPVLYHWDFGDGDTISGPPSAIITSGTNGDLTTGTYDNPLHTYSDTGVFTVTLTITNQYGCSDQVSYTITIEGDYIIYTPNAFTPNGDGINDIFFPKGIGIDPAEYELLVFNRWGDLIFETGDPETGWDGNHKGKQAKQDVYVWKVRAFDHKGQEHNYVGHVTLVK